MAPITAEEIREKMQAGLSTEASTLLTMAGNSLAKPDRLALGQELAQLHRAVQWHLAQGEALEQQGRIDEARDVYDAADKLSSDFPGLQDRRKHIEEVLSWSLSISPLCLSQALTQTPELVEILAEQSADASKCALPGQSSQASSSAIPVPPSQPVFTATSAQQAGRSPLLYTMRPGGSLAFIARRELYNQPL